jgi:hypothetical protein
LYFLISSKAKKKSGSREKQAGIETREAVQNSGRATSRLMFSKTARSTSIDASMEEKSATPRTMWAASFAVVNFNDLNSGFRHPSSMASRR